MKCVKSSLLGLVFIAVSAFLFADTASAVSCKLELKRFEDKSSMIRSAQDDDYILRRVSKQYFSWRPDRDTIPEFTNAVKKEPPKYEYENPYKGVVTLGSDKYLFVLDSSDINTKGFHKLYFDRNLNGDLTDDSVIEAMALPKGVNFGPGSMRREFPRQDLMVNVDGKKHDYSVFFEAYSDTRDGGNLRYAYAQAGAGAYRKGEVELEGKTHSICLLDFNSNGRFDDVTTVNENVQYSNGRIYPSHGDRILLDFNAQNADPSYYNLTGRKDRVPVAKLIFVNGKYYEMTVSPSGDSIELTPSTTPAGSIENSNDVFDVAIYNKEGVLKLNGKKGDKIPVPEGEWKLLEYTIDLSDASNTSGRQGWTLIAASGTKNCPTVKVEKGKTVEFPFGSPFKPLVQTQPMGRSNGQVEQVRLSLEFTDCCGAICTNLYVNGNRPPDPTFAIATPSNEIVERGKFEYG